MSDKEHISQDHLTYIVINFGKNGWIPYEVEMTNTTKGEILRMMPPGDV